MPISLKLRQADISVDNSSSKKDLEKLVKKVTIPLIYEKLGYIEKSS
jgi:hypothetical protein